MALCSLINPGREDLCRRTDVRRRFLCALPVKFGRAMAIPMEEWSGGGFCVHYRWPYLITASLRSAEGASLRSAGARFARLGCSYATLRSARVRGASKNDRYATLKHIPVFNFHIATQVQKASTIPVRSTSTRVPLEYSVLVPRRVGALI